jgi:hypothetical protein
LFRDIDNLAEAPILTCEVIPVLDTCQAVPELICQAVLYIICQAVPELVCHAVPCIICQAVPELIYQAVPEFICRVVPDIIMYRAVPELIG